MGVDTTLLVAGGYLCGCLSLLVLLLIAFRNRETSIAVSFGLLTLAGAGYTFSAAVMFLVGFSPQWLLLADPETVRTAAGRLLLISSKQAGPLLFVFTLVYAGHEKWLTTARTAAIFTVPSVYGVLVATEPAHGLVSSTVVMTTVDGVTAPVIQTDVGFQITLLYSYLTILAALVTIWRFMLRPRNVYRKQTAAIFLAACIPILANIGFQIGASPHPAYDLTPISFVVTGVLVGWALFRADFFDASPLASDLLIDELPDPVLVLNESDEIVDTNPAASALISETEQDSVPISTAFPGLLDHLDTDRLYSADTSDSSDTPRIHHYRLRSSQIADHRGDNCGRLIVLRDVTDQQSRQNQLEALQTVTQQFFSSTTRKQIASRCVEFAEQSLGQETVILFLSNDGGDTLTPVAMSDALREVFTVQDLKPTAGDGGPIWNAYENGTKTVSSGEFLVDRPFKTLQCYPLGDHGVLTVGTRTGEEQEHSVESKLMGVLAQTTQVALSQIEREREFRESRTTLARRNEQIEFFNDVLWHTLRNALLVVQGRASYLRDELDEEQQTHIDSIQKWCGDLERLSEKIRAVNQTFSASESRQLNAIDLSTLVEERVAAIEAEYEVSITVDVSGEVVLANQLAADVIDNVIRNAIIHNDRKHPSVQIWTQRAADRIQLSVADDGPGISREMKTTVFEQDLSARQTAEGFGLYFVSVMMNLYGGNVWFENNEPRGTVAVLEFQHADEESSQPEPKGTSLTD